MRTKTAIASNQRMIPEHMQDWPKLKAISKDTTTENHAFAIAQHLMYYGYSIHGRWCQRSCMGEIVSLLEANVVPMKRGLYKKRTS
jgi:hypothetical protein